MLKFLIPFVLFITLYYDTNAQQERCNTNVDYNWLQANAPDRYQRFIDLENFTANYINGQSQMAGRLINGNGLIIIPVVVHVLHRGEAIGTGLNISMAVIQSQIDVLNEDFRRFNADAANTPSAFQSRASDFGIEFRLACIDPSGNPTDGVVRKYTNATSFIGNIFRPDRSFDDEAIGIKTLPNGSPSWSTDRYLNIWVCNMTDNVGYSTSPADFVVYPQFDGVVISKSGFGRIGTSFPYNKGRTATHEIGHWLNLKHLWGDGDNSSCTIDDEVTDTPPQKTFSFFDNNGCPIYPSIGNRCSTNDPSVMFMNYMDYVNDDCYNLFTEGQRLRARALFASGGRRESQINNWFKVRQSVPTIKCTGIVYSSPACLPTTWSVLSGPATLTPGPGTNQATLQATGVGNVLIRATSGNYTTDDNISVSNVAPTVQGYYLLTSNYHSCPSCQNGLGPNNSHLIPAGQSACFNVYLTNTSEFTNIQWANSGFPVSYTVGTFGVSLSFCMVSAQGAYTPRTTTFTLTAQSSCGPVNQSFNFTLVTSGWYRINTYPNPAIDNLIVSIDEEKEEVKSLSKQEKVTMQLLSAGSGIVVRRWNFSNNQKTFALNIQGLRKGLYMLVVEKGKYKETTQIIIEE